MQKHHSSNETSSLFRLLCCFHVVLCRIREVSPRRPVEEFCRHGDTKTWIGSRRIQSQSQTHDFAHRVKRVKPDSKVLWKTTRFSTFQEFACHVRSHRFTCHPTEVGVTLLQNSGQYCYLFYRRWQEERPSWSDRISYSRILRNDVSAGAGVWYPLIKSSTCFTRRHFVRRNATAYCYENGIRLRKSCMC